MSQTSTETPAPILKRMDKVWYVPHAGHWNEWAQRQPCFTFHYDHKGHPDVGNKHGEVIEHELVTKHAPVMAPTMDGTPQLQLGLNDIRIRPGKPRYHWKAIVDGVHDDGSVDLTISHPDPGQGTRQYQNILVVSAELKEKPLHCCYPREE